MNQFYFSNGWLTLKEGKVVVKLDANAKKTVVLNRKSWLTILEIFIHENSLETAYRKFQEIQPPSEELQQKSRQVRSTSENLSIRLDKKSLQVIKQGFAVDLSNLSSQTNQIIESLCCREVFADTEFGIDNFEDFYQSVRDLVKLGLLSPIPGKLDWGDFRRIAPICNSFGFSRGTPIDRYYLEQFIAEICSQVTGKVLEVGGVLSNRELYQFDRAREYHTLDVEARPGVTLVGDVHSAEIIEPESLDGVVIFNVLEHCHNPWMIVQNIHSWLKAGGKCFGMVPNAQRLHRFPQDYWRPLPDGVKQLFQNYCQLTLSVYGNSLTVIASFMGVAAEELSPQELNYFHPDYPVTTCIVAQK